MRKLKSDFRASGCPRVVSCTHAAPPRSLLLSQVPVVLTEELLISPLFGGGYWTALHHLHSSLAPSCPLFSLPPPVAPPSLNQFIKSRHVFTRDNSSLQAKHPSLLIRSNQADRAIGLHFIRWSQRSRVEFFSFCLKTSRFFPY